MDTPICDFVRDYAQSNTLRLHMPGHKGDGSLGFEQLDITEIHGADSLYEADGIIAQSEANAGALFGCETFYSTEGSSQCIRAMLYLAMLHAKQHGKTPRIAAFRNVHKTFLSAVALLDLDVLWLYPEQTESYLSCALSGVQLDEILRIAEEKPSAIYLTAPDYLGLLPDIGEIARVCHAHDVLLLVDNAHGAYLRFLPQSLHPIDLGVDLCCSSAHKTLPVLTGGAYLHLASAVAGELRGWTKDALALFGSTSPSYLILQSLDAANRYLADYPERLSAFLPKVQELKRQLTNHGYELYGSEPLKLTIATKSYGYTGEELADILEQKQMVCEFADPDYLVLMLTPEIGGAGLQKLEKVLLAVERKSSIEVQAPAVVRGERVLSVREALFAPAEAVPVESCEGRILAAATVGCPPAVPILVCGERITKDAMKCFAYYGIKTCSVVCKADEM